MNRLERKIYFILILNDYFDNDVVIMMEMLQHISTMLWYALIMQTTGWFNDEVNFCNIIDQNPEICDGDDEEYKEIKDDDCYADVTTVMTMLNGHISAKDSSPKGKKVQLRGDK